MATPPPQSEQTPLNNENVEKQMGTLEVGAQAGNIEEKSAIDEMKEKLKKPAIGTSLIVYLILNVIMFFVGVTTTKDCPIQPMIPIYLAVAGALGIVTKIVPILNRNKRIELVDRILYGAFILEFIWMILGSYWIYSIYKPNYYPGHHLLYCNKTAYLLAFWLLTLNYIFLLLLILIPCCIFCCVCICASAAIAQAD